MIPRGKQFWIPVIVCVAISATVFGVISLIRAKGALQQLELIAYDHFLDWSRPSVGPLPPITIVSFSERDIQTLQSSSIPDEELAKGLENLLKYQPRAIGIDLFRDLDTDESESGKHLAKVLTENPNIVVIYKVSSKELGIKPPKVLQDPQFSGQIGFNDVPEDPDEVSRRALLLMPDDNENLASAFGLQLALLYLQPDDMPLEGDPDDPQIVKIGRTSFTRFKATDGPYAYVDYKGYQIPIDFRNSDRFIAPIPFADVLHDRVDPSTIRDRVVLIGAMSSAGQKDLIYTPVGRRPGVEYHANAIDQIIRSAKNGQKLITSISPWQKLLWLALWSLLGGFLGLIVRSTWWFAAWALVGTAVISFIGFTSFQKLLFIPVIPPVLAWFTSAGLTVSYMSFREAEDRSALMALFGRHVSKDVARTIWAKRDEFLEKGRLIAQEMTATVLFTDLKGFSSVSETMSPGVLMNWLNDYFQSMSGLVEAHGGSINKFNGDQIMALFGPPLMRNKESEIAADVSHAIDCAIQMRKKLAEMNADWASQNPPKPTTQMRIGICTGPLVAGSLGSKERLEYTVIGDTVNIASRLESYDKNLMDDDIAACGCRILISNATLKQTFGQYHTRPIGAIHLHGKKEPVIAHGVIGRTPTALMPSDPNTHPDSRSSNACETVSKQS